jgi:hypothetical protein
VLGRPYDNSVAMARLVLSGLLERHPGLDMIVNHAGAMTPFFSQRIAGHYPEGEHLGRIERPQLERSVLDGFKRFFVDTAIHGPVSAAMCSYDFFVAEHMPLGTDTPFGPRNGLDLCRWGSQLVDQVPIPESERKMIRFENALSVARIR